MLRSSKNQVTPQTQRIDKRSFNRFGIFFFMSSSGAARFGASDSDDQFGEGLT
jgi:hypothetical protein